MKQTPRQYQAEWQAAARRPTKHVQVAECEDRDRRKAKESDDIAWLMYYFGPNCGISDPFTYDFTSQQIDMVGAFGRAISEGGDQAIAASRGEGKTTIVERLIIKYALQGVLKSCILFQSTGTLASNSLDTIKTEGE